MLEGVKKGIYLKLLRVELEAKVLVESSALVPSGKLEEKKRKKQSYLIFFANKKKREEEDLGKKKLFFSRRMDFGDFG